jgi:rubrerythrin
MQLTQKENDLIKDLKDQEQLCIDKYEKHAACAADPQLKALFSGIAGTEREHLATLTHIENGEVPPAGEADKPLPTFTKNYTENNTDKKNDCYL